MLLKIVSEYRPASIVVAWDAREKTFRHEEYEEYKAQRPHMPEGLLPQQWPLLRELVAAFGIANLDGPGYEADDILGTLAEEAKRQGVEVGDRHRRPRRPAARRRRHLGDGHRQGRDRGRRSTRRRPVIERYGVTPAQIPDYIGLKGDTSDNIPGVPGVGEKTAAQLLQQFGSMETLYERLDEVKSAKRRAVLRSTRMRPGSRSSWRRWSPTCRWSPTVECADAVAATRPR